MTAVCESDNVKEETDTSGNGVKLPEISCK